MSIAIPQRTANNLKNKFYTVLRNLIKIIFRQNPELCPKISGQISSKDICRLYDGRENYEIYAGFMKTLLQEISYNLQHSTLTELVAERTQQIIGIYQTIYRDKLVETELNRIKQAENPLKPAQNSKTVNQTISGVESVIDNRKQSNYNTQKQGNQNAPFFYYFYFVADPTYIWPQNFC